MEEGNVSLYPKELMIAGATFTLYRGCEVLYRAEKYTVVDYGVFGVRLFRFPDFHLVVPASELSSVK
jgi:hypothetical protein